MTSDFSAWQQNLLIHTELALDRYLPAGDTIPQRLHTAMRYAVIGGGKRIRPLLAFAAGEVSNAPLTQVTAAACAVELIHAYSLVHDDLPCMDDDTLRRGKPTCHIAFDEPTALLAGDSLQSLAFDILSNTPTASPAQHVAMIQLLARASGSLGMAGGQAIDLDNVGQIIGLAELEHMHRLKTGTLIEAAVLMGALCGDHPLEPGQRERLNTYAHAIGLAFQVIDDVLDATASSQQLGKTAGKDALHDKPTYVSLMGCDAANQFALDLHAEAIAALQTLPNHQHLSMLADRIVRRDA